MSSFFPKKSGDSTPSKKQGSRAFRAKKFMASAMASSSTGRSTLGKLVGHDGEDLLKSLVAAEAMRGGEDSGKKLEVDVFKIAGKVGLLVQNKVVSAEHLRDGLPPLFDAGMTLLNACNAPRGGGVHTVPQISEGISQAAEYLFDIVSGHMQEKNATKILNCSASLSDHAYLKLLLEDSGLARERAEIAASIEGLLESGSMKAANENLMVEMRKRHGRLSQALAVGDFKALLKNAETKKKLVEFVAEGGGGDLAVKRLEFYAAVQGFKEISGRGMIKSRAGVILDKYLTPGTIKYVGVDEAEAREMEDLFDEGSVRKDIFDKCVNAVVEEMDETVEAFKSSNLYIDLVEEIRDLEMRLGARERKGGEGRGKEEEEEDGGGKVGRA